MQIPTNKPVFVRRIIIPAQEFCDTPLHTLIHSSISFQAEIEDRRRKFKFTTNKTTIKLFECFHWSSMTNAFNHEPGDICFPHTRINVAFPVKGRSDCYAKVNAGRNVRKRKTTNVVEEMKRFLLSRDREDIAFGRAKIQMPELAPLHKPIQIILQANKISETNDGPVQLGIISIKTNLGARINTVR
jgi:hypothetical protein